MRLDELGKLKHFIQLIGSGTCHLPAISIEPQPKKLWLFSFRDGSWTAADSSQMCNMFTIWSQFQSEGTQECCPACRHFPWRLPCSLRGVDIRIKPWFCNRHDLIGLKLVPKFIFESKPECEINWETQTGRRRGCEMKFSGREIRNVLPSRI